MNNEQPDFEAMRDEAVRRQIQHMEKTGQMVTSFSGAGKRRPPEGIAYSQNFANFQAHGRFASQSPNR